MTTRRISLPLQTRLAPIDKVDAESRTVSLTWTTGARVKRYDWENGRYYMEELSVQPGHVRLDRLNSGAPLLDTHNRYDLSGVLGVVEQGSAKVDGKRGTADVRFSKRDDVEPKFRDVKDKIITNVSTGYAIYRMEQMPPDAQSDGLPIYRAIDWEPMEISMVPIGADAGAGVRSTEKDRTYPCEVIDTTTPAVSARKVDMKSAEELAAEQRAAEQKAKDERELQERAKAAEQKAAEAAAAAERKRVTEIRALCKAHGMTRELEDELIGSDEKKGKSLEEARAAVLAKLAEKTDKTEIRSGHHGDVVTVQDEVVVRRSLMCNALMHRADPSKIKLDDGARQFAGYTLRELMRKCLELRGIKTDGMSFNRMWERTFESGADLANVVLDAANKSLRASYESTPRTFVPFTRQSTAPDFKNINRIQLSGAPSLDMVQPGAEYKRGVFTDGKEAYALATFGKIIGITRQVILNDDTQAFTRVPALFARAAADMESDTVWGIITTNGTLQTTGFALFGTGHANLTTGAATGTINITQIGVGRAAMRIQKGLESRPINVRPQFLIVPVAKEGDAEQFTSTAYVASSQSSVNPYSPQGRNPLTPIAEPRLDASSTASWYLAADPNQVDTIEYSYLEGQQGVYLESRMGFDVDGIEMKVREDFAAKALDYRGLWKAAGT